MRAIGTSLFEPRVDDRPVGGGEIELTKLARRDPAQFQMFVGVRLGRAGIEPTDKRDHLDHDRAIIVQKHGQGPGRRDLAAKLLADFAHDGGDRLLTGFDFSSGEFPFQGKVFVGRTLGNQYASVAFD